MMDEAKLVQYITELVKTEIQKVMDIETIPVGISARHIHLSQAELESLFGTGYTLTKLKDLSQPGQFAAQEVVELIGPKGSIQKVRILGPTRKETQVELALSDARRIGLKPPVRNSGDLANTPGITIKGPKGQVALDKGVIVAERHMHLSEEEARVRDIQDGDRLCVKVSGLKGGVMDYVTARVGNQYALDLHIDVDNANAFDLMQGQRVHFEKYKES